MSQNPTVWFDRQVFDPAQRPSQVYVKVISASEKCKLTMDDLGIHILSETSDGMDVHTVPWGNVQQAINVPRVERQAAKK